MRAVLLAALLLVVSAFAATSTLNLSGQGSTFQQSVEENWLFAYSLLRPEIQATYAPSGSGAGQTAIIATPPKNDWIGSDNAPDGQLTYLSDTNNASTAYDADKLHVFPLVAGQVALLMHFPTNFTKGAVGSISFATVPIATTDVQVNLTRAAAAGIFSGNITMWNDSAIVGTDASDPNNPNPKLTPFLSYLGQPIQIGYRSDSSGTTGILQTALYQFNSSLYPYTTGVNGYSLNSWPKQLSNATVYPNFHPCYGSTGVSGFVQGTPWSIGYAAANYAIADTVPVASLENSPGVYISPLNTSASDAALLAANYAPADTAAEGNRIVWANLINSNASGVYPLLSYTYVWFNIDQNGSDYSRQREVLKIFRWAWTTASTQESARQLGFVPVPNEIVSKYLLPALDAITVGGQKLTKVDHKKQHSSALFEVILAFTMLFWIVSLVAIGYAWYSSSRAKNPLFYALCLGFGTSLAFCSAIFFYLVPRHTAFCELRKWLLISGLTLLLGVMFARGWQLHALKSGPRVISTLRLLIIVSVIFGVQLIILICWSAIDPWKSEFRLTNDLDLRATYRCHSHHMIVWLLLELAFFIVLLAWGIYVVYATWRNRAAVDSRWTLIAVYNTLIALLVAIPLVATAVNTDDWVYYVTVLGMDFAVTSCVFSIYGSAIFRRLWDSVQKTSTSGDSGENGTKVSSLRMTVGATVQS